MDRGHFIKSLRETTPLIVAGIASILNTIAFVVDVLGDKLDSKMLALAIVLSSVTTTVLLWLFTFLYIKRKARVSRSQEFTILSSEDIFEINTNGDAVHRRILSIKVNQESQFYLLYSPDITGTQGGVSAYQADNPSIKYDVLPRKSRKALLIDIGRTLKKNEKITNLCLEWKLYNTFVEEQELVTVHSESEQERCIVRVILPPNSFPLSAEWFCSYSRSLIPLYRGASETTRSPDGKYIISHDFGLQQEREADIDLNCTVTWQWERPLKNLTEV